MLCRTNLRVRKECNAPTMGYGINVGKPTATCNGHARRTSTCSIVRVLVRTLLSIQTMTMNPIVSIVSLEKHRRKQLGPLPVRYVPLENTVLVQLWAKLVQYVQKDPTSMISVPLPRHICRKTNVWRVWLDDTMHWTPLVWPCAMLAKLVNTTMTQHYPERHIGHVRIARRENLSTQRETFWSLLACIVETVNFQRQTKLLAKVASLANTILLRRFKQIC